jgi:chemotaxis receptor (MCP) glutamine deamidase CheD
MGLHDRHANGGPPADGLGRPEVTIGLGEAYASSRPTLIKTLVGSCVAVCYWDNEARVGGMNHFLVPGSADDDAVRFGVHAMDLLMCEMMRVGAERRRIRARIFGGAHALKLDAGEDSVAGRNVRFVRTFMEREAIGVLTEDLGGSRPRLVQFQTDLGLATSRPSTSSRMMAKLLASERSESVKSREYGTVTLF